MPDHRASTSGAHPIALVAFRVARVLGWICFIASVCALSTLVHYLILNGAGRGVDYAVYAIRVMVVIVLVQLPLAIVLARMRHVGQLLVSLPALWIPFVVSLVSALLSSLFLVFVVTLGM